MQGPLFYVNLALVIYMILLLLRGIMDRVNPRPRVGVVGLHEVLRAVTEPYLRVVRLITPPLKRGTVDWSIVVGVTAIFVLIQVLRWIL